MVNGPLKVGKLIGALHDAIGNNDVMAYLVMMTARLIELHRVLKPTGRMVITSMTPGRRWYSRIWDWLVRRYPNILEGCRPISLKEDVELAGFGNIHEEYVSQFSFPSLILYAEKP